MNQHLASLDLHYFEGVANYFFTFCGKDVSYYRNRVKNSATDDLIAEALDFFADDINHGIDSNVDWYIKQDGDTQDAFIDTLRLPIVGDRLLPSQGDTIFYNKDAILNEIKPISDASDVELLVGTMNGGLLVSIVVGEYIKFKNTFHQSISSNFYHISRFKIKTKRNHTPAEVKVAFSDLLKLIENGEYKPKHGALLHVYSPYVLSTEFKIGSNVFSKFSGQEFRVEQYDTPYNKLMLKPLGDTSAAWVSLNASAVSKIAHLRDTLGIPVRCGDRVKLIQEKVDSALSSWGITKILDNQSPKFKDWLLWKIIAYKAVYKVVDYVEGPYGHRDMGDLYIEMNYVADHPDLVKALDLSKITLKVHTGDIYVVNEQEDNTTRFESLARKKQEEEMSKKKKAKEAEEYDRTHGPYEMSQWKDKLIVIDGVFDETIKGKKAIVQEVDNLLGRIVVKTENEKEYYFRMSMGHLKEFKIISGKVVSSEEQPELV